LSEKENIQYIDNRGMNRKAVNRAITFIIIIILIILLFRDRSPFGKGHSSFATEPGDEITRIEFSQSGEQLSLERTGNNWFVNGDTETRKSGINFIIRILQDIEIKSPVSDELFEKEISENQVEPVKVRVYENRRQIKSFLVYKTGSNIYGNIMKMRESSKPFIVYVPGFEGDIGSAFTLNELFWQPYLVFSLLPSEIASVQLENFSDPSSSFEIFNRNHNYRITDMKQELYGWDTTLVTRYLSYFARIPFEAWLLETKEEEMQKQAQKPLYRITVKDTDSVETTLTLWERVKDENGTVTTDIDRLYGKTGERDDLFIIRYFDVDPILKRKSYFFPD
jgi:hypothetical protein